MCNSVSIRFPQKNSSIISLFLIILLITVISLLLIVLFLNIGKKICQTKECFAAAQDLKDSMNFDVNPCDDFYKYACGNWLQNSGKPRSTLISRAVENYLEILDFLKQNNSDDEPEAVHKARKLFSLCIVEGKTELSCTQKTTELFSWAVSYMYAKNEKYMKAKTEIRTMFKHLREAFQLLIEQASWMDEMTRKRALKKLHEMRSNIAYPSIITNTSILDDFYIDVQITSDNFTELVSLLSEHRNTKKILNRRGDDWAKSPNIVNAYYYPGKNIIYILAGILGFPLYHDGLGVLRYGVIGSIVGHEMTHAFDNNGRRYNEVGNLENWWQNETAILYKEKAKCFVQAKRNYTATSNKDFDKDNLGEDLSDNLGFKEALFAYRKCVSISGEEPSLPQFENFTHEQLLTLAYANVWCEIPSSSNSTSTEEDEHSTAEFRVNGVLQNSKEFSEIWKCPKGSKMNPSDDKCEIW